MPHEEGAENIYDRSDTYNPEDNFPTEPSVLEQNPEINVVMYAWCGQTSDYDVNSYISQMESLEQQYPDVTFVYMTGNAQETDCAGCSRYNFNEALREYARSHGKVLYDFGDLDAWYNGDMDTYNCPSWCADAGRATPMEHEHWGGGNYNNPCGHTTYESCENKGNGAWQLFARIAGWDGT